MAKLRSIYSKLIGLFRRRELDERLDAELQFHIDMQTEENLSRGMTPREARRQARIHSGGVEQIKELHRDVRGLPWAEDTLRDTRFALRQIRYAPAFTAAAVLSLALGISANTAIFTLIESALLQPIPVKHMDRLRLLTWREQWGGWVPPNVGHPAATLGWFYEERGLTPDGGLMHVDFSPPVYEELLQDNTVFASLFGFRELGRVTAVVDGNAEPVNCFLVSGDFYSGLEITPVLGQPIGPEQDRKTADSQVVLISYDYWTRRFGRSPSVIGKTITLNGLPVRIIGVNPKYFTGIEPGVQFDIWAPLNLPSEVYGRSLLGAADVWSIAMMGRLREGVSDQRAQSALDALFQSQVNSIYLGGRFGGALEKPNERPQLVLQPADRGLDYLTGRYDRPLLALLMLAGLVLLIACANVANLLLAKSATRQREMSLRLALGARHGRIVRQLLTEGLLLASLAGVVGILVAFWTRGAIPDLLSIPWRPSPFQVAFDPTVLLISAAVTLAAGVLFSLAPIWQSRRIPGHETLNDGGRGSEGLPRLRIGRLLVGFQFAVSILLLAVAGMSLNTLANLRDMPLGFQPQGVFLFALDPPRLLYSRDQTGELLLEVQHRLTTTPGILSASFSGSREGTRLFSSDGSLAPYANASKVGSHFFETLGIPILHGRAIGDHEARNGPPAVVINEQLSRQVFQERNPVGETFEGSDHATYLVVGVCGDWQVERLRDVVPPTFYSAWMQAPTAGSASFVVKIAGDDAAVAQRIRQVVRSIDPNLVVLDLHTARQEIDQALSQERLLASLAAAFGTLALALATIGIYGIMAYAVERRATEIGIRVALGARPRLVTWLVVRETLLVAVAGIGIGIAAVLALNPVLNRVLAPGWRDSFAYGLNANDPRMIGAAVLVLGLAGLTAAYLPAHRAACADPMTVLRQD